MQREHAIVWSARRDLRSQRCGTRRGIEVVQRAARRWLESGMKVRAHLGRSNNWGASMAALTLARSAGLSVFLVMGTVNAQDEATAAGGEEDVTELSDIEVTDSPLGALGKEVG